jgi:membrane protein
VSENVGAIEGTTSVGKQVIAAFKEKDFSGIAKQIAYDILFSLAPLLIFITALAGAVTQIVNSEMENPAAPVLDWMTETLPADAASFLEEPIANALETDPGFLLSFGAIFALWGAKNAMSSIIKGLNAAYDIPKDERSFVRKTLVSIGLTIGLALLIGLAGVIFVLGTDLGADIADGIGLGGVWNTVSEWARWPMIAVVIIVGVALIHSVGPNVDAHFRWFVPGAAFSVVSMGIATIAIGFYFAFSGGYNEAYGAFGSVLAFIFWLWIMGLLIVLGGVVNMAIQREIPPARGNVEEEDDEDNANEDVLTEGQTESPGR